MGVMKTVEPLRILLVEDRPEFRTHMERFLRDRGHSVTSVENGEAALRLLENEDHSFQILVSDYEMPEMDGVTLIRELAHRSSGRTLKLMVLFTGREVDDEPIRNLIAETEGKIPFRYIHKLTPAKEVLAIIEAARSAPEKD